jgi:uncharacterized protein (DUF4415 family)
MTAKGLTNRRAGRTAKAGRQAKITARSGLAGDAQIDTSDIPPLTEEFFRRAIRNPFYRPVKQSTTVRIDADVLAWLKSLGPGYQTRINALLRAAMARATNKQSSR